jgi:predicted DNA-binding transcriptional regulator AlpA
VSDQSSSLKIRVKRFYETSDGSAVRVIKVSFKRNLVIAVNYNSHSNESFRLDEAEKNFSPLLKIGEVAKMFGKKSATIRRYESSGLLPKAKKISLSGSGNYWTRLYSPSDIEILAEFFDSRKPAGRPASTNVAGINREAIKDKLDALYMRGKR